MSWPSVGKNFLTIRAANNGMSYSPKEWASSHWRVWSSQNIVRQGCHQGFQHWVTIWIRWAWRYLAKSLESYDCFGDTLFLFHTQNFTVFHKCPLYIQGGIGADEMRLAVTVLRKEVIKWNCTIIHVRREKKQNMRFFWKSYCIKPMEEIINLKRMNKGDLPRTQTHLGKSFFQLHLVLF